MTVNRRPPSVASARSGRRRRNSAPSLLPQQHATSRDGTRFQLVEQLRLYPITCVQHHADVGHLIPHSAEKVTGPDGDVGIGDQQQSHALNLSARYLAPSRRWVLADTVGAHADFVGAKTSITPFISRT
jgi:hypothetical protein